MDFSKLKLNKFSTYNGFNLPDNFIPPLQKNDAPEVYFLFVSNIQDIMQGINYIQNNQTHKENRIFFVFKKGQKHFNRDHVYNVVMTQKNLKRKAPLLSSLNKEYSVFAFTLDISQ